MQKSSIETGAPAEDIWPSMTMAIGCEIGVEVYPITTSHRVAAVRTFPKRSPFSYPSSLQMESTIVM